MVIPDKLKEFINELRQPLPPVTDEDEPLRMDSLAVMRLVAFLESDLGFVVDDAQLVLENFETLRGLGRMLEGHGARIS
jgi:acyl carrier protein